MTPQPTPEGSQKPGRDADVAAAVRAGGTLRAVGQRFGITHERVRQLVDRLDPDITDEETGAVVSPGAIAAGMTVRAERQLAQGRRRQDRPTYTKTCPICGEKFTTTNARRVTNSPECAEEWLRKGRNAGPERMAVRQDHNARSILRNPSGYSPVKVRWAMAHLERRGMLVTVDDMGRAGRAYLEAHPEAKPRAS